MTLPMTQRRTLHLRKVLKLFPSILWLWNGRIYFASEMKDPLNDPWIDFSNPKNIHKGKFQCWQNLLKFKGSRKDRSMIYSDLSYVYYETANLPQAPLSMEFSRQEYWSGLPFPSPGDLLNLRIEPVSPALVGGFFTATPLGFYFPPNPLCNPS